MCAYVMCLHQNKVQEFLNGQKVILVEFSSKNSNHLNGGGGMLKEKEAPKVKK